MSCPVIPIGMTLGRATFITAWRAGSLDVLIGGMLEAQKNLPHPAKGCLSQLVDFVNKRVNLRKYHETVTAT